MVNRIKGRCERCPMGGGYCPACDAGADVTDADGYHLLVRCLCFGGGFYAGCAAAVVLLHYWK